MFSHREIYGDILSSSQSVKDVISATKNEPSNIEFLISIIGSLLYTSFNGISLSSTLLGNQDGQHTKQTLLCISNEVNGTLHV